MKRAECFTFNNLFQGYKWDKNEVVVQWIEEQLSKSAGQSIINHNIHAVKKDAVINQIKSTIEASINFELTYIPLYPWFRLL